MEVKLQYDRRQKGPVERVHVIMPVWAQERLKEVFGECAALFRNLLRELGSYIFKRPFLFQKASSSELRASPDN